CEYRLVVRAGAIASRAEVIEQVGGKTHVRGGEGQFREVRAHDEAVRDGAGGGNRSKSGTAIRVVAQIVEQIRAVADVSRGEDQRVEIGADIETIGHSSREGRVDSAEGGAAIDVMAEVIEQIGAETHI